MDEEITFCCSNCHRCFPSKVYLLCHCNPQNISCYFKEGEIVLSSDFKFFSLCNVFSSTCYTVKDSPPLPENLTGIVYAEEYVMYTTPNRWNDRGSHLERFSYDDTVRSEDSISMVSSRGSSSGLSVQD